jgi:AAA+ superfamily predicted ATPase
MSSGRRSQPIAGVRRCLYVAEASQILSDVLAKPKDAIFYELSRALKASYSEQAILETQDDAFQVHGFSHAGHCRMRDAEGVHTHWTQGWDGRRDHPYAKLESGWLQVEWEGHGIIVVTTGILGQYCREVRSYVIADSMKIARDFFEAVCRWGSEVHGEVLVFREGRWLKSEELFESIGATSLDNLVLPPELKEEVSENVRGFFQSEETYAKYGLPWKRGLLFLGPPGNGKTHMIKGLAKDLGKPCLYVRSFRSQYGTDHDNIGKAFERARDLAPCLLVLEDLDALVDDKNRSYFLNEMDGFYSNRGILTVATTNHPEKLDPAILERPSRFDRKFTFPLPDEPERLRFLRRQIGALEPPLRMSEEAVASVANRTDGFSYAYLKELVLSSMMAWIREDGRKAMDEVLPSQLESLRAQMKTESSAISITERMDPLAGLPPAARAMMERAGRRR